MDLIVCLCLIGYCLTLTRFSKWPIEFAPFFVISTIITLLYCFAYWHFLKAGADGILMLGGFLFLLSPIFIAQEKDQLWKKYFTPGFIISLGFLALFLSLSYQVHFAGWDEFTHWGPHSKLVFFNNGFLTKNDVVIHKSYPLGGALFQYLFFRLSGYSEGTAYVAQCLLIMASLSILIHQYRWESWKNAFIAYTITLTLLLLLRVKMGPVDSLYMDSDVGIYFGMMIAAYFTSQKNISTILYLIPMVAAMTLFKQKLFPLILMATVVMFIDIIIFNRKNIFPKIGALILLPMTACFVTHSWHQYLKSIGTQVEWKLNMSFAKLHEAFFASAGSVSHHIIFNYLHALILPTAIFVAVIVCLNWTAYLGYQKKKKKMTLIVINIVFLCGFIAYLFGLLLMYLFSFTVYEGLHHASMQRYLHIYYLGWSIVVLYFLFDAKRHLFSARAENNFIIGVIIGIFGFFVMYFIHQCHFSHHQYALWKLRQPIIKIANAVKKVTKPTDKIFTIWQDSRGAERAMLLYELTPRKPNLTSSSFGKPYSKNDVWTNNLSPKKLLREIGGYNYLLLGYSDKNFWTHYQSIMPNRHTLKPVATYTICMDKKFSSLGDAGCVIKQHHAYLFKIININGKIHLVNVK